MTLKSFTRTQKTATAVITGASSGMAVMPTAGKTGYNLLDALRGERLSGWRSSYDDQGISAETLVADLR